MEVVTRKLKASLLVTLDGVVQDPGGFGETDQGGWAGPFFTDEARQSAYEQVMAADYFLCGRLTYELLSKAWGNVSGSDYLDRVNAMPKLVASRTLTGRLEWNATVIDGDVAEAIRKLKQEPGGDIVLYGSASFMQTLMKHDLIDEFRISIHPIVLGRGKRLFPEVGETARLRLAGAKALDSGVTILTYLPAD